LLQITSNAQVLLNLRYLQKGENWEGLVKRVAETVSQKDLKWTSTFIDMIKSGEFIPASPFMMNAGINNHFFSCYVLPVEDSLKGIYKTVADAARIFQMAGGCGYDFSSIRPEGSPTSKNPKGEASGPLSFMKVFDASCKEISSGGSRKGAQMGVMHINHPDIYKFIKVKRDLTQLTQFNISCAVTEKFIKAVEDDEEFQLHFPNFSQNDKKIRARDLWKELVHSAWLTGDPGLIFIDRFNEEDSIGGIRATNPCSEQGLPPYGCCDLGSINLSALVEDKTFDWVKFDELIKTSVRFLDNAIDVNNYTLPEIKERQLRERRIGLGIMGVADALIKLGLSYDSEDGRKFCKDVAHILDKASLEASQELAKEKGAFPDQPKSKLKDDPPIRNAMRTTIAPTGSISIIAGCSSGIEPIFALAYTRHHDLKGYETLDEVHPLFIKVLKNRGIYSKGLIDKIKKNKGSCQGINEVPKDIQRLFKIAADITPEDHIRMTATWQEHIQNGISKTINLPNNATEEDVENAYLLAYKLGCKGITVFRDGCRGDVQVLSTSTPKVEERDEVVQGSTTKVRTSLGTMYVTVNVVDGKPFEVFVQISKGGTNAAADAEGIARLVSLALRSKTNVKHIVKQLKGIGSGEATFNKGRVIASIPDAIAYVLEKQFLEEKIEHPDDHGKYFPSGSEGTYCKDCN